MEKRKANIEEKNKNVLDYQKENVTYEFILPKIDIQNTEKKEDKTNKKN